MTPVWRGRPAFSAAILLLLLLSGVSTTLPIAEVHAQSTGVVTLTNPDTESDGWFGLSVAVSGSTVVVGAPGESETGQGPAPSAYVFDATTGALIHTLTNPNWRYTVYGAFGSSVAVSGNCVVIGAYGEGAGYVFVFDAATGALIHNLTSPNSQEDGEFGYSVAVSGSTVAVGAPGETVGGYEDAGRAYVFDATTGALTQTLTSPNAQEGAWFGWSVAASGDTVVVGSPYEKAEGYSGAGHAYVFDATTGALVQVLTSPDAEFQGMFGYSAALSGNTVVVGDTEGPSTACVFDALTGALIYNVTSPNPQDDGEFGNSVAANGSAVVVGAVSEDVGEISEAGSAYVFGAATGALVQTLTSPNPEPDGWFGSSVAMSGDTVVVGAKDVAVGGNTSVGSAYVFYPQANAITSSTSSTSTSSSTTSTTSSSTSTTSSTSTSSSTTSTTSSSTSAQTSPTSSSSSSSSVTSTSSSTSPSATSSTSSGVPEFPFQLGLATLVTFAVVTVYVLTGRTTLGHRARSGYSRV